MDGDSDNYCIYVVPWFMEMYGRLSISEETIFYRASRVFVP